MRDTSSPRSSQAGSADQLELFQPRAKRGGKRRGAGRKPKGLRAGAAHKPRRELSGREPVHVTLRVVAAVGNLRRRDAYRAIREATITTARRESFRIVQLSIQRTHVHLLVEAENKEALASGMQGFQISAAKHLNAAVGEAQGGERRRGTVFPDRYFAVVITTPRQARNVLAYIMGNWRRHGEHTEGAQQSWRIDWFSSASSFPLWREYGDDAFLWDLPAEYDPLVVYQPRTWLLREGWKRHGLISCYEVPAGTS